MNTDDKNHQLKYFGWVTPTSSIDGKNDQLKASLKEVGSLLHQLEQDNQLNQISQDNQEDLLQLKEGIDALIRDSFLPTTSKYSEPKIIPPDPSVWRAGVRKRRVSYKQKQVKLNLLSEKIESMQVRPSRESGIKNYPKRLQDFRGIFFKDQHYKVEQDLYVYTHNCMIDIKLELRAESKKEGKKTRFSQTKASKKVNSYNELKQLYQPKSLNAIEYRYRQHIFEALQINSIGNYEGESWVNLIIQHQNVDQITSGDEYPELKEGLRELIDTGKFSSNNKGLSRKVHKSGGLDEFMV